MTEIMASRLKARPPELSQQRLQPVEPPGNGRGTTTTTPLPGTDDILDDRRTRAEYPPLLHALGPSNGLPTSRYPMSTNMNLSRIRQATRTESATASTGGTTRGRSRDHHRHSPPRDRRHPRRQEDTCGVSALTPRLRAIQWPPNFKVSNVDKDEPKQDPGGWLAVYTTAARAAALGPSNGLPTSRYPMSTKMNLSKIQGVG